MNKAVKIFLPLLFCASLFTNVCSQVNDAGVWAGFGVEKQITQAFSVEFAHDSRFNENVSELRSIINEIGVNYKFDKKSQVSLFYRYFYQLQLNNQYIPGSKIYADYSYKTGVGNFDMSLRLRFQIQQKNIFVFDSDGSTRSAVRPKYSIKYKLGKTEPYLSAEAYFPVFYNGYKPLDKIRICAGIGYSFNKMHSIDLGYMVQKEYFTKNPLTDFVFQAGYKFKF